MSVVDDCGKTRLRDCVTAQRIDQRFNPNGICMVALFRRATKTRDFSYSFDSRNHIGLNDAPFRATASSHNQSPTMVMPASNQRFRL